MIFSRFILWLKKIFHIRAEPKYREREPPAKVASLTTEEIETEQQINYPTQEDKTEEENIQVEKGTQKPRKPYKKKTPTEERKKNIENHRQMKRSPISEKK